jgi:nucleotide-binding universal stress UspA family protein
MYKTIVVHVDGSTHQASRLRAAALLANTFDAHLIGSAVTGLSWANYAMLAGAVTPGLIDETFGAIRAAAREHMALFEEQAGSLGVTSIETRLIEDQAGRALQLQARFADLIVLGQDNIADPARPGHTRGLPERVVLEGARPVLVVPDSYAGQPLDGTVVVGWDGSVPALRAVAGALPLLQRARTVRLVLVNPQHEPLLDQAQPGADMATYLARHGVAVDVAVDHATVGAGEVLLARAEADGAGLIVAGAFGHARYREWVLGGATRDLLERARVPVLFAH